MYVYMHDFIWQQNHIFISPICIKIRYFKKKPSQWILASWYWGLCTSNMTFLPFLFFFFLFPQVMFWVTNSYSGYFLSCFCTPAPAFALYRNVAHASFILNIFCSLCYCFIKKHKTQTFLVRGQLKYTCLTSERFRVLKATRSSVTRAVLRYNLSLEHYPTLARNCGLGSLLVQWRVLYSVCCPLCSGSARSLAPALCELPDGGKDASTGLVSSVVPQKTVSKAISVVMYQPSACNRILFE